MCKAATKSFAVKTLDLEKLPLYEKGRLKTIDTFCKQLLNWNSTKAWNSFAGAFHELLAKQGEVTVLFEAISFEIAFDPIFSAKLFNIFVASNVPMQFFQYGDMQQRMAVSNYFTFHKEIVIIVLPALSSTSLYYAWADV